MKASRTVISSPMAIIYTGHTLCDAQNLQNQRELLGDEKIEEKEWKRIVEDDKTMKN